MLGGKVLAFFGRRIGGQLHLSLIAVISFPLLCNILHVGGWFLCRIMLLDTQQRLLCRRWRNGGLSLSFGQQILLI